MNPTARVQAPDSPVSTVHLNGRRTNPDRIAYVATNHVTYDGAPCVTQPGQLTIFSIIGACICALAMKLIWEFATHARTNFIKSDYCKARIPGLDTIFTPKVENDDLLTKDHINANLPYTFSPKRVGRIFRNLNYTSLVVGAIFAMLLIAGILSATNVLPTCSTTTQSESSQSVKPQS